MSHLQQAAARSHYSPFWTVCIRAGERRLPEPLAAHAEYLASEDFRARLAFAGETADADRALIAVEALSRVAIDPDRAERIVADLARGVVWLDLFGVVCPLPIFEVEVGSPEHQAITQAVAANLASPMMDAARRVLRSRQPSRVAKRERRCDAIRARLYDGIDWPRKADYDLDPIGASQRRAALGAKLDARMDAVRDLRRTRLARLAAAAAPGVGSWTEFVDALALALAQAREQHSTH